MKQKLTRGSDMTQGFLVQLGVFLVVNAAVAIYTLIQGGDFWWISISVIWAIAIAAYGAIAFWLGRRDQWEDETGKQRQRLFVPPNPLD